MRLWKARNEWANARTRNFTKSRVTQGGSLLKVLRLSQAVCSALLFKVRSLLWLDVVVFAPTLKNRSHYWVRLKRTSTAIRPGREANEMGSFPRQRWWGRRMPSDITIAGPVCHVEVIWIHEEVLDFITSSRSLMRIHWGIGALSTNSRLVVLSNLKFYITVCMYQCMVLWSNQSVCYENTLIVLHHSFIFDVMRIFYRQLIDSIWYYTIKYALCQQPAEVVGQVRRSRSFAVSDPLGQTTFLTVTTSQWLAQHWFREWWFPVPLGERRSRGTSVTGTCDVISSSFPSFPTKFPYQQTTVELQIKIDLSQR